MAMLLFKEYIHTIPTSIRVDLEFNPFIIMLLLTYLIRLELIIFSLDYLEYLLEYNNLDMAFTIITMIAFIITMVKHIIWLLKLKQVIIK
jgi:hypothetical protein